MPSRPARASFGAHEMHVMKPLLLAGALLSAVPVFAADAAKPAAKTEPKPQADFTFPERPPFHTVKPEPFDRLRTRMTNAVVLDVRTPDEFAKGHIPGAKLIDFKAADFTAQIEKLDKSKRYLVHCAVGGRSAKACGQMDSLKFEKVLNLSGGITAWEAAGHKPVKGR